MLIIVSLLVLVLFRATDTYLSRGGQGGGGRGDGWRGEEEKENKKINLGGRK